jgi:hypothetical protein
MTPFRIGHKIEYMHQNIKIYYAHGISLIHDVVRTLEMCPAASKPAFQWYEYALDVVGFQRLEMDEASFDASAAETSYAACMISMMKKSMRSSLLSSWKRISTNWLMRSGVGECARLVNLISHSCPPPNASNMHICKRGRGVTLPFNNVKVIFVDPNVDLKDLVTLSKIRGFLSDFLDCLRKPELVMEATEIIGGPVWSTRIPCPWRGMSTFCSTLRPHTKSPICAPFQQYARL